MATQYSVVGVPGIGDLFLHGDWVAKKKEGKGQGIHILLEGTPLMT
jgi:hypothetical protein